MNKAQNRRSDAALHQSRVISKIVLNDIFFSRKFTFTVYNGIRHELPSLAGLLLKNQNRDLKRQNNDLANHKVHFTIPPFMLLVRPCKTSIIRGACDVARAHLRSIKKAYTSQSINHYAICVFWQHSCQSIRTFFYPTYKFSIVADRKVMGIAL